MAKYDWNDGKGKKHSIPLKVHKDNVAAVKATGTTDFRQPTSPVQAMKEVNAGTTLQYGGQENQLKQALSQSDTNQTNNTNWFQQYKSDIDQTRTAQNAYIQGQVDANKQAAAQAGTQTQFAPGTDASVQAAEAQGAQQRESQANLLTGALRAVGAAESNYAANQKNTASAAQLSARMGEQKNADNIRGQQTQLKAEEGAYKTKTLGDIRDRERQYTLESSALGVKQDVADNTAKNNAAKIKAQTAQQRKQQMNADRQYKLDTQKFGATQAKDRYQRKHKVGPYAPKSKGGQGKPTSGPGSITAQKEMSVVSQVNRVHQLLANPPAWPDGPSKGKRMTAQDVAKSLKAGGSLSRGKPLDPNVVNIASSLWANKGKLGPGGVNLAHKLNLHVHGNWSTT